MFQRLPERAERHVRWPSTHWSRRERASPLGTRRDRCDTLKPRPAACATETEIHPSRAGAAGSRAAFVAWGRARGQALR